MSELLIITGDFPARVESALEKLTTKANKMWSLPLKDCNLQVESTSTHLTPIITFHLKVTKGMLNGAGALHGGCATTLIDDLTTVLLAAVSKPGLCFLYGVSQNLRIAFFQAIQIDDEMRVVCKVEHVGRRLVVLGAKVYRAGDGKLCMSGENEKMNTDPRTASKI